CSHDFGVEHEDSEKENEPSERNKTPATTSGRGFAIFRRPLFNTLLGTMTLKNSEVSPITDVTISLIVRQFMDAPKEWSIIGELKAGEERGVALFALFKNNIFEVKQSTKVSAEISVSYTLGGRQQTISKVETLRIYDRNAMLWDDTNKAAAF